MKKNPVIERYCELVKEEPLSTLEPELTDDNSCVLESTSPFFGYYHDAPMANPDPYIYCVLADHYSYGEVIRAAKRLNENRQDPVDIAAGRLFIQEKKCPVIRIKDIRHFNQVKIVQQGLRNAGILFKKKQRNIKEIMGVIHLCKILYLVPAGDGMYMDAIDDTKAYFSLPVRLQWSDFKLLTEEAKYDTRILYFDAAQAMITDNHQIIDLVRVYKEHISVDQLRAVKNRYHELIK